MGLSNTHHDLFYFVILIFHMVDWHMVNWQMVERVQISHICPCYTESVPIDPFNVCTSLDFEGMWPCNSQYDDLWIPT